MVQVAEKPVRHPASGIASVLSPDSFDKLKSIMYDKTFEKGAVLYWEGDPADKLYFIRSGLVRVTKTTEGGRSFTFHLFRDGDLFGQIDPFKDSAHVFSAEAMERTQAGVIQRKDLEVLLWQHGDFAIEFVQWMGMMNRLTQMKFRDFMTFGKPGALCSLLIRLGTSYGEPDEQGLRVGIRLNHAENGRHDRRHAGMRQPDLRPVEKGRSHRRQKRAHHHQKHELPAQHMPLRILPERNLPPLSGRPTIREPFPLMP